jgi:hypothetical protein
MNLQSRTEKEGSTTMRPCGVEVAYKIDGKLEVALISLDLYKKLVDHIANLQGEIISVKLICVKGR